MLPLLLAACTSGSSESADTTATAQPLSVAVVLDLSTSWSQVRFDGVRVGLAALLDARVAPLLLGASA